MTGSIGFERKIPQEDCVCLFSFLFFHFLQRERKREKEREQIFEIVKQAQRAEKKVKTF